MTLVFAFVQVVLGLWVLRIARSPPPRSLRNRIFLVLIGALGLVSWAGILIGPLIAFLAAAVPEWQVPPAVPHK